ncbi:MAG: SPFH/Band 7/PHB domain protein [Bacilli bacterium]|nr:SPFH/Band 7/PHB domain protein [Bacilli bacterium]
MKGLLLVNVGAIIAIGVIAIFALIIIASCVRQVRQTTVYIIERLGKYHKTWNTGIHLKAPFIERIANVVSLKEQIRDFPPQPVITKDNVTMQIDTVVFYQITDPKLYTYGVENPIAAIENLSSTTLRNIIGELDLDETLTSRDIINSKMRAILDEATDAWGIKVTRVEVKNILPPKDIRESMERQMRAERERRETILLAEGEKKSAILRAEGEKESAILKADAQKERMIREAEGEAQARIKKAEAEATAIKLVKQAEADSIVLIKNAAPTSEVLTIKSLEALKEVANGQATKIIIPSEIQNLAGLVTAVKEVSKDK